jgi:hypothetical protein
VCVAREREFRGRGEGERELKGGERGGERELKGVRLSLFNGSKNPMDCCDVGGPEKKVQWVMLERT